MKRSCLLLSLTCLMATVLNAESSFHEGELAGRKAWIIENGIVRVSVLPGGGHIGELRFLSGDAKRTLNPMFIPAGPRGYVGHLLCFPSFGPASPPEVKNGLTGHGEAGQVEWKLTSPAKADANGITLIYGADLPKTQYHVQRTLRLGAGESVLYVEEVFENLAAYDRPYNRMGHATVGMPFAELGKNFFDTSATQGMIEVRGNHSLLSGHSITRWPEGFGPDGKAVDLRGIQPIGKTNTFYALAADEKRPFNYFTMYNTDYPLLIGFILPGVEHPWIVDWQNNQGDRFTRGIEFGTSPFDEGLRRSVERGSMLGVPTFQWIDGRGKVTVRYAMFLAEIPQHYKGVQDVEIAADQLVVIERETGSRTTLKGYLQP